MAPIAANYSSTQDAVFSERTNRRFHGRPLPPNAFLDSKLDELTARMATAGFKRLSAVDFQTAFERLGYPKSTAVGVLEPDEYVFSRASDKATSNFFVFAKKTKDGLVVSYYNPASDRSAILLPYHEVYVRRVMSDNASANVEAVVTEILQHASLKPGIEYRGQFHNHAGYFADVFTGALHHLTDDGESDIIDNIRAAAYHHLDVALWTPHNWLGALSFPDFNWQSYRFIRTACEVLGIVAPQALELSVPVAPGKPSGPHTLLVGDQTAMSTIQAQILSKRDPRVTIGSCYLGLSMDEIFSILDPLRSSKHLALGIPHPWSDSSIAIGGDRILRLESTGWLSAVDTGRITMDRALETIFKADWVAGMNVTLTTCDLSIDNPALAGYVTGLIARHVPYYVPSANTVGLALAAEVAAKGRNTAFDPDAHRILPMSFMDSTYEATGFAWGMGHTRLAFSPALIAGLTQKGPKLPADAFAQALIDGHIRMGEVAFHLPNKDKMPVVPQARTVISGRRPVYEGINDALSAIQTKGYVGGFIETLANLGEGAFDILK